MLTYHVKASDTAVMGAISLVGATLGVVANNEWELVSRLAFSDKSPNLQGQGRTFRFRATSNDKVEQLQAHIEALNMMAEAQDEYAESKNPVHLAELRNVLQKTGMHPEVPVALDLWTFLKASEKPPSSKAPSSKGDKRPSAPSKKPVAILDDDDDSSSEEERMVSKKVAPKVDPKAAEERIAAEKEAERLVTADAAAQADAEAKDKASADAQLAEEARTTAAEVAKAKAAVDSKVKLAAEEKAAQNQANLKAESKLVARAEAQAEAEAQAAAAAEAEKVARAQAQAEAEAKAAADEKAAKLEAIAKAEAQAEAEAQAAAAAEAEKVARAQAQAEAEAQAAAAAEAEKVSRAQAQAHADAVQAAQAAAYAAAIAEDRARKLEVEAAQAAQADANAAAAAEEHFRRLEGQRIAAAADAADMAVFGERLDQLRYELATAVQAPAVFWSTKSKKSREWLGKVMADTAELTAQYPSSALLNRFSHEVQGAAARLSELEDWLKNYPIPSSCSWVDGRFANALGCLYRPEMVQAEIDSTQKKISEWQGSMDPEQLAYVQQMYPVKVAGVLLGVNEYAFEKGWGDMEVRLAKFIKSMESDGIRFMDRVEKGRTDFLAQESIGLEKFALGRPHVTRRIQELREQMEEAYQEIHAAKVEADVKRELDQMNRKLPKTLEDFDRFHPRCQKGLDELHVQLQKALETWPDDDSLLDFAQVLAEAHEDFKERTRVRFLKENAEKQIKALRQVCKDLTQAGDRSRDDLFPTLWQKAENLIYELKADSAEEEVFLASFPELEFEMQAARAMLQDKVFTKAAQEDIRKAKAFLDGAVDKLGRSDFDAAGANVNQAEAAVTNLVDQSEYQGLAIVTDFLAGAKEQIEDLKRQLAEIRLQRELEDKERTIKAELNASRAALDHHNTPLAIEKLSKTKSLIGLLESEPDYRGHKVTERILSELGPELTPLDEQIRTYMLDKDLKEAIRVLRGKVTDAGSAMDHHNYDKAIFDIQTATNLVEAMSNDYEGEAQATLCETEARKSLEGLKERYSSEVTQRKANSAIGDLNRELSAVSEDLSHLRFEMFVSKLQKVKSTLGEMAADEELSALGIVSQFIKSTGSKIQGYEQEYSDTVLKREAAAKARELRSSIKTATDHLDHSRHEHCLAYIKITQNQLYDARLQSELLAADSELEQLVSDSNSSGSSLGAELRALEDRYLVAIREKTAEELKRVVAAHLTSAEDALKKSNWPAVLKSLASYDQLEAEGVTNDAALADRASKCRVGYRDKVSQQEAKEAKRVADAALAEAKDKIKKSDYAAVISALQKSRSLAATVASDSDFMAYKEISDWLVKFSGESLKVEEEYAVKWAQRQSDDLLHKINSHVKMATSHLDHHRDEAFIASAQAALLAAEELRQDAALAKLNQAKLDEAVTTVKVLQTAYADKVLEKLMSRSKAETEGTLKDADTALDHFNYVLSLRKCHEAKVQAAQLIGDPLLEGHPDVEAFFESFKQRVVALETKLSEKLDERRKSDAKWAYEHELAFAKDHLERKVDDKLVGSLNKCTARLEEAAAAGQPTDWVQEQQKVLNVISDEFADRIYKDELARRMQKCESSLASAVSHLDHSRSARALEAFQAARDAYMELVADERFGAISAVDVFAASFHPKLKDFGAKLDDFMFKKEFDAHVFSINALLNQASSLLDAFNAPSALAKFKEARTLLEQHCGDEKELVERADEFRARYSKAVADKEVRQLTRKVDAVMDAANRSLQQNDPSKALEAFNDAKAAAGDLGRRDEFQGHSGIVAFFATWKARSQAFVADYEAQTLKKERQQQLYEIKSRVTLAENQLKQNLYAACWETVREARPFAFDDEWAKKLDETGDACTEKLFEYELSKDVHAANSALGQATLMLDRYCADRALDHIQTARGILSGPLADFLERKEVLALVTAVNDLEKKWAADSLAEEARILTQQVGTQVSEARTLISRGATELGAAKLAEARELVDARDLRMPAEIAIETVEAAEKELAPVVISEKEASEALAVADKALAELKLLDERGLDFEAEFQVARSTFANVHTALFKQIKGSETAYGAFSAWAGDHKLNPEPEKGNAGGAGGAGGGDDAKNTVKGLIGGTFLPKPFKRMQKIKMDTNVDPQYMREYKQINVYVDLVNESARVVTRVTADMERQLGPNISPWGPVDDSSPHAAAEIERCLDKLIPKQFSAMFQKKDATLLAWKKEQYDPQFNCLLANKRSWTKAHKILKTYEAVQWAIDWISKMAAPLIGAPLDRLDGATNYSFDWHRVKDLTWGAGMENILNVDPFIQSKVTIYDIAFRVRDTWVPQAIAHLDQTIQSQGGVPDSEKMRAQLQDLSDQCLARHGPCMIGHLIFRLNYSSQETQFRTALASLRKFPLARQAFLLRVKYLWEAREVRSRRAFHAPKSLEDTLLPTTEAEVLAECGDPLEEKAEWYADPELVVPGSEGTTQRRLADESNELIYGEYRRKHAGKIVFANRLVERTSEDDSILSDSFEWGKDTEVFGRAHWPTAMVNYQLAKDAEGKALYGPERLLSKGGTEHWLEVFTRLSINGEVVEPNGNHPDNEWAMFRYRSEDAGGKNADNFWSFALTCRIPVLSESPNAQDDWTRSAQKTLRQLMKCGAGNHTVKLDLCFRVTVGQDIIARRDVVPARNSLGSVPLASGEFTITLPNGIVAPPIFPITKSAYAGDERKRIEDLFLKTLQKSQEWGQRGTKPETVVKVSLDGDWYVSREPSEEIKGHHKFKRGGIESEYEVIKHPGLYSLDFNCLIYRSPLTGWAAEYVVVFSLRANQTMRDGVKPTISDDNFGISSNYNTFMDVDALGESELALFERCPERMRTKLY